jgi:hypothetical protein
MKLHYIFRLVEPMPTIIVLAVALPFLYIGFIEIRKAQTKIRNFTNSTGVVIGNDYLSTTDPEDSARISWAYYPVVRFTTTQGREFVFTDGVGTYPPDYEVGDAVDVLYNPQNPRDATIKNWLRVWFAPLWITAIGFLPILSLIGWMIWKYVQAERLMKAARASRWR